MTPEEIAAKDAAEAKLLQQAGDLESLDGLTNLGTEVKNDGDEKKVESTGDVVADVEAQAKADAEAKARADADAKAKEAADAKAKEEADAKAKDESSRAKQPDGVLLKDGKTVVPYPVLAEARHREQEERKAREDAERRAAQAEQSAKEARDELERIQKGGATAPKAKEELDALREKVAALTDVPEVKDAFDALTTQIASMQETISELRDGRQSDDERRAEEARARVQDEIDRNATLRYWQNEKPDLFNEAVRFDKAMRESDNPAVRGLPLADRFAKSVQMVENLHGATQLPAEYQDADAKAKADAEAKARADSEAKARADAAAKSKDVKAGSSVKLEEKPLTLSDLPGGTAPTGGQKALEEMTTGDIEASVNRMLDSGKGVEEILGALR